MRSSAGPSNGSLETETASATPPSKPSRLRRLSYLRSCTPKHLLSFPALTNAPRLTRSTSTVSDATSESLVLPSATSAAGVASPRSHRSASYTGYSTLRGSGNGWIPPIYSQSSLLRQSPPAATAPATDRTATPSMTRDHNMPATGLTQSTSLPATTRRPAVDEGPAALTRATLATPSSSDGLSKDHPPTIRFIPHVETRSSRPSLHFPALSLTPKTPGSVVRVGRYSERDVGTAEDDVVPVGFKSKVVSRRHCEFWCTDGQWYVKDVKSSSGTFLNHVRLSNPGVESRPYPVNDGDVVQLGIDFKGGEEVIFRCVKMKIECNRDWQKGLNTFNKSAHKRLFQTAAQEKRKQSDAASVHNSECSICLNRVSPCQALFVAPCSHVWHYKCVRNLIHGSNWPNFLCPNCRYVADLEADVEQPEDDWEDVPEDILKTDDEASGIAHSPEQLAVDDLHGRGDVQRVTGSGLNEGTLGGNTTVTDEELADMLPAPSVPVPSRAPPPIPAIQTADLPPGQSPQPITIAHLEGGMSDSFGDESGPRAMTPTTNSRSALTTAWITDGPVTPRNDAGPFVLDGSAGRERLDTSLIARAVLELGEQGLMEEP